MDINRTDNSLLGTPQFSYNYSEACIERHIATFPSSIFLLDYTLAPLEFLHSAALWNGLIQHYTPGASAEEIQLPPSNHFFEI